LNLNEPEGETPSNSPAQRSFFVTLLPLFVLAHFAHHLLTALPIPLLPFIRNAFQLNYTQSALVSSAFSLSYGIGQLPAGWLADRFGSRILVTTGILGVALAGFLVGLSHTFIMMIVFLVLMGLLGGGYHPAAAPLISSSVEPEKRGRALGFHMIGGHLCTGRGCRC
jgi:MFS family permease